MAGNSFPAPRIGVLALQGGVREHADALRRLGAEVCLVRRASELDTVDGLILPGGESTTMERLARTFDLWEPLRAAVHAGLPVYGTCAGLILLSERMEDGAAGQESLGGLDITVRRNAFGRQLDSFEQAVAIAGIGPAPLSAVFIRAPLITEVGPGAEVIARLGDGRVVGVRQGRSLGTAFHPELTGDDRLHALFLELVAADALPGPGR